MHVADLTVLGSRRVAVGWLHPDHDYTRGAVPPEFVRRVNEFASRWNESVNALGWGAMGGCHQCEFCGRALGFGTFGVPYGDKVFDAPEMVGHYVEEHGYAPPPEFVAAVLACPLPGTPEYASAVARFAVDFDGPGDASAGGGGRSGESEDE